jgi:hypothetical protein
LISLTELSPRTNDDDVILGLSDNVISTAPHLIVPYSSTMNTFPAL